MIMARGARATYRDAVYDIRHARKLSRRERRALRQAAAGLETRADSRDSHLLKRLAAIACGRSEARAYG